MQMGSKTGQETQLYSKKDFFTEREKKTHKKTHTQKQKQNETKTTRTRKKEKEKKKKGETDELLMFTVGKDSALFSGL